MSERLPPAVAGLPRFRLAALPTPLEPLPNLSRLLGINLLVKRDDLTGLALGGNKARSLEFIVGDAREAGASFLITTAAAQSNFCRMVAAAGRRAGMRVGLLLRGTRAAAVQGNLLLDYLLGAEIRFTEELDPYAPATRERLDAWANEEVRRRAHPYVIDIHGRPRIGALATSGYVAGADELDRQCDAAGISPDHLYVAVGSGSTIAGLALGARDSHRLNRTRLVGVCVGALSPVVGPRIRAFEKATSDLLALPNDTAHPVLRDDERGEAYGASTPAAFAAIRTAARADALILNPVYTGKAFAALLADVRRGDVRPGATVIFLNTGGDPLVFAYADPLARANPASAPVYDHNLHQSSPSPTASIIDE